MIDEHILDRLRAIVGDRNLKTGDAIGLLDSGADPRNLDAAVLVSPATVDQVSQIAALCNESAIAIVPHGGRTGLVGGGVSRPGQIILSLSLLAQIEEISVEAGIAVVQAGVTLQALQDAAAQHGLSPGIDLASRGSATIGGMIATNAGGMDAFRHGTMRQRILGLEAVLADGRVMRDMAKVTKSNEGYDLKQLFIGSEGTLGMVTRAVIKLVPRERHTATALVACSSVTAAVGLFHELNANRELGLLRCEFMAEDYFGLAAQTLGPPSLAQFAPAPAYLIVENDANDASRAQEQLEAALTAPLENAAVIDALIARNGKERSEIWNIREDSNVVNRIHPTSLWFDVSVPLNALDAWLDGFYQRLARIGLSGFVFGHLGDGNLHVGIAGVSSPADKDAAKAALYGELRAVGGSFSAEHGIGSEKKTELAAYADPVKFSLMRSVKTLLDPRGIMNPGKIFD